MFRRLFWLFVGVGFGFGMSQWLTRTVRRTVERYSPANLTDNFTDALRSFGADLRDAVTEGREAMHEREAQLRAELSPR